MRVGVYAGSFDPPTLGHADIIARAAALLDRLVIGLGMHQKKQAQFDASVRETMLEGMLAPVRKAQAPTQILVRRFDGLLVDFAASVGAQAIVRGLRNATDYDYEAQMSAMNRRLAPGLDTWFLLASPQTAMISSSLVRQIAGMGGDISSFVPPSVLACMNNRGGGRSTHKKPQGKK